MSLGRHSIANLSGAVVPLLVALITIPLYLRYIGPERYGVLAVIMALTGYFGFFDLGLGRAVTQRMARISDAPANERSNLLWTAITASFLLGVIGGVVLWIGAEYLITNVIDMSGQSRREAIASALWLGIALPFLLPVSALSGALHAKLRFVEVNIIQVFGGVLGLVLPVIVAWAGYVDLSYLVPVTLASRVLTMLLLFDQCRRHVPLIGRPCCHSTHLQPLLRYGGWISIMTLFAPLLVTIDRIVIGSLIGARAVASYTVPYDLVSRAMVVSGSFSSALFPRLASAGMDEGRLLANRASAILVAIITPIVIAGLFLSQPFLNYWVGVDFAASSSGVAEILLIGVWINAVVIPHHTRYLATQSPRAVVLIFLFEIPIYLLMLWYGIIQWGVLGAAAAWTVRVILDTTLLLWLNSVLAYTASAVFISLSLIITASLVVYVEVSNIMVQFLIALLLLTLSVLNDRKLLLAAYNHVRNKEVAGV